MRLLSCLALRPNPHACALAQARSSTAILPLAFPPPNVLLLPAKQVEPGDILFGDWGKVPTDPSSAPGAKVQAAMAEALRALSRELAGGGAGALPVQDPRGDLRLVGFELGGVLERRGALAAARAALRPAGCGELGEQYALVRALGTLRAQRDRLRHELSDASLQVNRRPVLPSQGTAARCNQHGRERWGHSRRTVGVP